MKKDQDDEARQKGHGRFKPGVSGNPRGRPKKRKLKSDGILQKQVAISFAGRSLMVSRPEAVLLSLAANGFKGEKAALETFLAKAELFRSALSGLPKSIRIQRIIVRAHTCDSAFSELGIWTEIDGRCGVPMWIVKEAIKRRPSLDLSGLDRSAVLSLFENKSAAEKLLLRHGLAPEMPGSG